METSAMNPNIRIGALISGSGTNLQAIMDACKSGQIRGRIVFIGSDNPNSEGLKRGEKFKIPSFVVNYGLIIRRFSKTPEKVMLPEDFDFDEILSKQTLFPADADKERMKAFFATRAIAEAMLLDNMKNYPFDLLVLAGFMRNLTPYFIDRVNTVPDHLRIMNIHPALLPAFPGIDGYGDTFRYGCKIGGCTVHFVDYGEDSGPIIGQRTYTISEDDTIESVREKGLKLEWTLYPECVKLFAEGRLKTIRKTHVLTNGKKIHRTVVRILPSSN
jgi:phosphoribosylglycinamide formyltransferase-1